VGVGGVGGGVGGGGGVTLLDNGIALPLRKKQQRSRLDTIAHVWFCQAASNYEKIIKLAAPTVRRQGCEGKRRGKIVR